MSIIFRCSASLHTVFLFLVFIYNLKVTLGQIIFGNRLVFAVQGGYFFMVNTIKKVHYDFLWDGERTEGIER